MLLQKKNIHYDPYGISSSVSIPSNYPSWSSNYPSWPSCEKNKKNFLETDLGGGGYGGATPPRGPHFPLKRAPELQPSEMRPRAPPGRFFGRFSTNETNRPTMERDFYISFSYNFRGIIRGSF